MASTWQVVLPLLENEFVTRTGYPEGSAAASLGSSPVDEQTFGFGLALATSAHDRGPAQIALAPCRYWHLCNCRLGLHYVGLRTAYAVPRAVGGKFVYGPSDDPGMQRRRAARHVAPPCRSATWDLGADHASTRAHVSL